LQILERSRPVPPSGVPGHAEKLRGDDEKFPRRDRKNENMRRSCCARERSSPGSRAADEPRAGRADHPLPRPVWRAFPGEFQPGREWNFIS
jgi:hypothetical protein